MKSHDQKLKTELLSRRLLTEEQCRPLEEETKKSKISFKNAVLQAQACKEEDIAKAEADLLGISFLDMSECLVDEKAVKLIPKKLARNHCIMPVFKIGKTLTIATADPQNVLAIDEVRAAFDGEVEFVLSTKTMIKRAIDENYGSGADQDVSDIVKTFDWGADIKKEKQAAVTLVEADNKTGGDAPAVKFVNLILSQALEEKASDIHIEPEPDIVRVRNRVDGVMHEVVTAPKRLHDAVVSRIKVMAKLDIAETRKPQDGKIQLKVENRELDLRVSTFPTVHGENVVLRILEHGKMLLGLKELGLEATILTKMASLIRKSYGIILVTGPTGAGKTTTLYAALNTINSIDKNIITIEDPVEYQMALVRQTQVNPKADLTFATGLRSILRQDPDVILVGEIRDAETADIAIQAALTGHLVFSTVHTNNAAGAVTRLLDMGTEPFLISSALIGAVGQRLVRVVCDKCKEPYHPEPALLQNFELPMNQTLYRGKGCSQCKMTGYYSRAGIFELLTVDDSIRRLILARASTGEIDSQARKSGMISMRADGIQKAAKGITTLEEVLKVTQEESDH